MSSVQSVSPFDLEARKPYDLAIAALGFETRARFLADKVRPEARMKIAAGFTRRQVLEYGRNRDCFKSLGWRTVDLDDNQYLEFWHDVLQDLGRKATSTLRVWCDVSSSSRLRIATLLDAFRTAKRPVEIDFVYCIAQYSDPPQLHPPNGHVGPVTKNFAGWTEPDRGAVALVGLGYEENKALGAVEHIQATDVWAFTPTSAVDGYIGGMKKANAILLNSIPRDRRIEYTVERPFDCFVILESLTHRIVDQSVPVFFPFGPKIFALCSMLVGCVYSEKAAVWRVSAGSEEEALDRLPSPSACGLHVSFEVLADKDGPPRQPHSRRERAKGAKT